MKKLIKLFFSLLKHPLLTISTISNINKLKSLSVKDSLKNASDWLLLAQSKGKDLGYSRKYSLISGWDSSYIETSGYIVPSMYLAGVYLNNSDYIDSAKDAAEWLLTVQHDDGFFTDIDEYKPQVFDTGQVLIGLNFIYKKTEENKFKESIVKACDWLISVQEENGSWIKYSYNYRPHTYYTRVASALLNSGYILNNEKYIEAAIKNLNWAISQKQENNFFNFSEFKETEDPILHTLVYVLEGFSEAYRISKDNRWLEILESGGQQLLSLVNNDGLLHSQYNSEWEVTNSEYCVTGLAQLAGIFYDLSNYLNSKKFFEAGEKIMSQLLNIQLNNHKVLSGAFPSSLPLWGYYGGMDFYNWNSKFYIDATLKKIILSEGCPSEIIEYYFNTQNSNKKFLK